MQIIKRLFNFYIFSNIHVAIGTFCFVKITLLSFGIDENETALFVFFSTIVSYNFIRFMDAPVRNTFFGQWFYNNKSLLIFLSVISGVACLYFLKDFHFDALLVLSPFVFLTLFYGMKLPKKAISLRRIPGLKIFVIAFCFAGITVLFPLVQNKLNFSNITFAFFLERLLFVILITLPFDIRDIDYDSKSLKTIPQLFGVQTAKFIGIFLAISIFGLLVIYHHKTNNELLVTLFMNVVAIVLLLFSKRNQATYYSSFWVEGLPILWYAILIFSLKM